MANLQAASARINDAGDKLFNALTSSTITDIEKLIEIEKFLIIVVGSPAKIHARQSFHMVISSIRSVITLIEERQSTPETIFHFKVTKARLNFLIRLMEVSSLLLKR